MDFEIRKIRTPQGRKKLTHEREEYFRLIDQGFSSREACRIVGITTRYGQPSAPRGSNCPTRSPGTPPTRYMLGKPYDVYRALYRNRLEGAGVDAIRTELAGIAGPLEPGRPLVLLCFDRLNQKGAWCHRTMFAAWWQEHTGQDVPELGTTPPAEQEPPLSLF
jgi:hypothetical protein